jgi:hypothetical protein
MVVGLEPKSYCNEAPKGVILVKGRAPFLITAQDMFFTPAPASDGIGLIDYMKGHL